MSKLYHLAMIALLLVSTQALGQMNDNFETGAIGNWTQSTAGRWAASSDHPIDGLYSLKHSYDNPNADVDFVGTTLNLPNITQGDVTWRFQVKHEQAKIDESLTLNNGLASTNDIVISKPGKYFARIACAELPSSQLNFEVANKAGCDIEEDFESDVLPAWPSITEWKIDHSASLNGTNSLKHDGLLSNNISTLVIPSMLGPNSGLGSRLM